MNLTVATINLGNKAHDITAAAQRAQVRRLGRLGADVIVTQEAVSSLVAPVTYRALPVLGGGAEQVRILVRRGRAIRGYGYDRAHPGVEGQWPARWIGHVTVDFGGRPTTILGTHLNSRIEADGAMVAVGARRRYTIDHIDAVADLARFYRVRMGHRVIVTGDLNADAYADARRLDRPMPSAKFADVALREALPATRSGTLGGRRVDRMFATLDLRAAKVATLPHGKHNDHSPVVVSWEEV